VLPGRKKIKVNRKIAELTAANRFDMITGMLNFSMLVAAAPAPGASQNSFMAFLPMILIFAIFYFILIAPMRKRQKKTQAMLAQLKKGDQVITNGGIYGRIAATDESTSSVILQISDQVKIKVARSAIAGMQGGEPVETSVEPK
jgi:preprotein translocase subunit YajC